MDKKKLDFNAPFLSVRRLSSTLASPDGLNRKITEKSRPNRQHSLPLHQSDRELSEVTKPAAVPFLWEQIPGRPKGRSETQPRSPKEPSNTPRRPPERVLDIIKHVSDEGFHDRNAFRPQIEASPLNNNAARLDCLNKVINAKEDSDLESRDDAYSDALDTLSPTESFSFNYSVSGLSGYDGPDVKPSGTFCPDPQTRDFMMSRFLPAAKAMVLEMPQYVSRKQHVVTEQPRQIKKVVSGERRPLVEPYKLNSISPYGQCIEDVESEDEEEHDDPAKNSAKACGMFPRLCVKNSLCLLNPVPIMKLRTPSPFSSAGEVRRLKSRPQSPLSSAGEVRRLKSRPQSPLSSAGEVSRLKSRPQSPLSSTGTEVRRLARTAYSGPLPQTHEKKTWDAVYMKKIQSGVQSRELHEVKNKLTGESSQFNHSNDSFMTDRSSPYRHSRGGGISPYRNEAPKSPFTNGARFLGVPKEVENVEANKFTSTSKWRDNFQDVSPCQTYKHGSGSVSPVVEKTLYIDSVNNIENPILNSEAAGFMNLSGKTLVENRGTEQSSTAKSFSQDISWSNHLVGSDIIKSVAFKPLDADLPSSACISMLRGQEDRIESLKLDQDLDQESRSSECSKVNQNGNLDMSNKLAIIADGQVKSSVGSLESPRPPPLPKSPSESWLWRTLPSISLRNPFSHLHSGNESHPKKQGQKTSTTGAKWETIVKTSNMHHDHMRYSKELVPYVSQHSKT